jgi:hypothetical protein
MLRYRVARDPSAGGTYLTADSEQQRISHQRRRGGRKQRGQRGMQSGPRRHAYGRHDDRLAPGRSDPAVTRAVEAHAAEWPSLGPEAELDDA